MQKLGNRGDAMARCACKPDDRGLRGKPQTALSVDSNFPGFFENLKICDFD